MALTVNTNIINDTDQYLLDAKNVKGGYIVVNSTAERNSLPAATTVKGSLCYCTADSKFYQYNGSTWVEKEFGTAYTTATADKDGLMSKVDKANLDTIVNSFNNDDSNTTIDTVKEVLKAFENAPEGTNIANALAEKSNIGHNHEVTTTTVLTGVKASGTDTFIKTISGGSGSLTSNTTATDGIKYVDSVTHSAASLTGTKTFNTDAIKDVTLSASTTSTDGPAYIESVTHTAATLGGTNTFNTNAIKSVSLSASTTTTDGPKYVESISGSAPSLTGDKTFVKTQGTLSGGSGSLEVYDAATNGTKKVSNGTRIPFVTNISNTPATASGTTTVLTGVKASGTDTFVKTINGGSGSLKSYEASSGGNAKTSSGRVPYLHDVSHTAASLTGDKTFVKTQGTFSAGTTPVSSAAPTHTSTNSGSNSGTTGTIASYSAGVLTINATVDSGAHTHTYDKTTGITLTRGTAPSLGSATTGTVGISGGSISKTTYYLDHAHTAASAGSTGSAVTGVTSDGTTTAVTGVTGGTTSATTHYLAHSHTAASLGAATTGTVDISGGSYSATTKYMKPISTAADTGTVSISGGSITPVTKYMKKTNTAASTGTVGISGGSITPSTKYLHHTHTAASTVTTGSAVTDVTSNGTVTAVTAIADAEN